MPIESYVRDAFVHKQFFIAVFFDLEKAYDATWRHYILLDLHRLGICGNMFNLIASYLTLRVLEFV